MKKMIILIAYLSLFACSQHKVTLPADAPSSYLIKDVPFVKQKENYCAAASSEMVLKYHGYHELNQDDIIRADMQSSKGTRYQDLVWYLERFAKKNGFEVIQTFGNLEELKFYILQNCPVIVRQWARLNSQNLHYRVAIGYDDEKKKVICNDPAIGPGFRIDYEEFMKLWDCRMTTNPTQNLMIIVRPKKMGVSG